MAGGRPKANIDWNKVGQMLEAGCSGVGIASTIGVDEGTLRKRCESDNNCSFSELMQQKKSKGDDLLRVKQFQTAMSGNVSMQIWLGKQRLGQREKTEISHITPEISVALKHYRRLIESGISKEKALKQIIDLMDKTGVKVTEDEILKAELIG